MHMLQLMKVQNNDFFFQNMHTLNLQDLLSKPIKASSHSWLVLFTPAYMH